MIRRTYASGLPALTTRRQLKAAFTSAACTSSSALDRLPVSRYAARDNAAPRASTNSRKPSYGSTPRYTAWGRKRLAALYERGGAHGQAEADQEHEAAGRERRGRGQPA